VNRRPVAVVVAAEDHVAMSEPLIRVCTWRDGVFTFAGPTTGHELPGRSVTCLARDPHGRILAVVDQTLCRRADDGTWRPLLETSAPLACCTSTATAIYLGTDDAQLLRVGAEGTAEPLPAFASVPGREAWYAGSAIVDGRRVGPPLGVRSLAATGDGAVLLVNVHVGGIPRSTDDGRSWQPTLDIELDVHEVCTHPTDPRYAVAAAAAGLCSSADAGRTWRVETEGLHASYCNAVAFFGADVLISCAEHHFAAQGAVYRRPLASQGPLERLGGGFPEWTAGIVDTRCIAVRGRVAAIADGGGNLHVSTDGGASWSVRERGLPGPTGVLID
jgi:photosystem II stability/assembly factor-like uncharacterized protein